MKPAPPVTRTRISTEAKQGGTACKEACSRRTVTDVREGSRPNDQISTSTFPAGDHWQQSSSAARSRTATPATASRPGRGKGRRPTAATWAFAPSADKPSRLNHSAFWHHAA